MMCAERMQRIMQAIILGLILGLAGSQMFAVAFVVTVSMMIMLFIAGVTGFCPGLMILKNIFPSCDEMKTTKDNN
jgi:uncharacterized membrane protein YbjE (DUF340 family)